MNGPATNALIETLLACALDYAVSGWPVFPLHSVKDGRCTCGKAGCGSSGKHPRTEHGLTDATTDAKTIEAWWAKRPDANIGVLTGAASGLIVVDVDPRNGGDVTLVALLDSHGPLPATVESQTGGGGRHIFFKHPGGTVKSGAEKLGAGLDVKADGGYIVAPPSLHISGRRYEWEASSDPGEVPVAEAPAWLLAMLGNGKAKQAAPAPPVTGHIPNRERNDKLTSLAGTMRRRGISEEAILAALQTENRTRCKPPLPDSEVEGIARSIGKYPPASVAAPGTDGPIKRLADAIGAEHRFARDTGGRLYVFSEGAFRPHGEQTVKTAVKRLLVAWGESAVWSAHRAEEVAEYIRVDAPALLDRPPADTVNLANGLLDVNCRTLRPHDPEFLSPVQLPVAYDPTATCPEWERFIAATFPPDTVGVPWELAAWLMLPDTSIQKSVLLLGEGANGKSTFLAALSAFIGKRNIAGLSLQKLESDRFAVARLVGKLANVCPDLPSAHLSGTSVFKTLTGGDVLLAERKYADSFEFSPFARLIFSANHPPRSHDASHAFYRRWLVVPFCRTFAPGEQIPRNILDARLAAPKELSGVLNKALDALPSIRVKGITETQSMRDAWNEFREATDPVAVWLDGHTILGPDVMAAKRDLLAAYNAAARHEQRPTLTPMGFGQALKRLRPGIQEAQRTIGGVLAWVWLGIGLVAERPPAGNGLHALNALSLYC